ncbi:SDR family oxidoreductase [Aurantibacillus circumpalustris]|uniref:SDR family oxidoreductase n=1 Tax=Aurantibacillus circumpalustris TaxID=3036359 RepID=UPI00295A9D43|nr:SDR family oxidoreductase [Aurantibacillus circumpalustris]
MLIVVTGASKGIGFEMVKLFSKDPSHLVIAISRNIDSLNKMVRDKNTHSVLPIKADISKIVDQKKIVKTIKTLNLKIDVLVNNAGTIVNKPFEKINEKELQSVYATNVFAPFTLIQALLPLMNTRKRPHIINISSIGGFQGSSKFPGLSAYSSSKAALVGLTECLAEEFKTKNIAVNCLALGAVQTEMLAKAFPGYKAPLKASQMAEFICNFALTGHLYFNGKIIPVSSTTP